jgi:hypothetical protein
VDIKLSSAFHPQTDGQIKHVNQVLEQNLRCNIIYQQDDWTTFLSLLEFAYNNMVHSSTQQTPFFANYGYPPRLDSFDFSNVDNPPAKDMANRLLELHVIMEEQLKKAQEQQKMNADAYCKEQPQFNVGDKVWLLRRNIKTT